MPVYVCVLAALLLISKICCVCCTVCCCCVCNTAVSYHSRCRSQLAVYWISLQSGILLDFQVVLGLDLDKISAVTFYCFFSLFKSDNVALT